MLMLFELKALCCSLLDCNQNVLSINFSSSISLEIQGSRDNHKVSLITLFGILFVGLRHRDYLWNRNGIKLAHGL